MAKNEALETSTLVVNGDKKPSSTPGGSAQFMRKDSCLLLNGVWYMSARCPALEAGFDCQAAEGKNIDKVNGLVDEQIPWERAKTPHHAGLLADQVHEACARVVDEENLKKIRAQEIVAAEHLLKNQHFNRDRAAKALQDLLDNAPKDLVPQGHPIRRNYDIELDKAKRYLARHEEGLKHAEQRLKETRENNS